MRHHNDDNKSTTIASRDIYLTLLLLNLHLQATKAECNCHLIGYFPTMILNLFIWRL